MKSEINTIAPERVIKGEYAWNESKKQIVSISKRPLLLGRSESTLNIRNLIENDLYSLGIKVTHKTLKFDCCEVDLKRLYSISKESSCDAIIASGGGKVLDAGKLLAERLNVPCITIPLSPSTCAGWTALSNIYSQDGAFIKDQVLIKCPKLLIFDYSFVRQSPSRLLASGIADALAKWYESSLSSGDSKDVLVQQAVQMARVLRDQLMIDSKEALKNSNSYSWIKVAESCALTAGLIGGIGGARCRTAAAHAIHNGLTQLKFSNKALHGELVGFGLLVQLRIEELMSNNELALQTKNQLLALLIELGLPISLKELGITNITENDIKEASIFSCKINSDIHNIPFKINKDIVLSAILDTDNIGQSKGNRKERSFCY